MWPFDMLPSQKWITGTLVWLMIAFIFICLGKWGPEWSFWVSFSALILGMLACGPAYYYAGKAELVNQGVETAVAVGSTLA
jgi:hypothetical protein